MKKALFIFLLFAEYLSSAQFVDDSTKNVYGAHTTFFTSEKFIKNNLPAPYQNPDTTVYLHEKYTRIDGSNRQFQHLGFIGSAILDQRYNPPKEIGRTFGFSGYNYYFKTVNEIKYFDTKSPYMDVGVVFGGENRSKIDLGFSRNVNENWNLGFNMNRITADKQIGRIREGDRAVESVSFDLYTHYTHKKVPYEIAFSFTRLKHEVADVGGVFVEEGAKRADFFLYEDAITQLEEAVTRDQRTRFHVYQQYKLGFGFEFYHQFDQTDQEYNFTDFSEIDTIKFTAFYPRFNINEDTTSEKSTFSSTVNEVGLKGEIKGAFYRFYVKHRALIYETKTIDESARETYAGASLRFNWQDKFSISGNGELSEEGLYKLKGELSSDFISISYVSMRSSPSFLALNYDGNHHDWANSFKAILTNGLSGQLNFKRGGIAVSPQASILTVNNFVYLDADQVSTQASDVVVIGRVGGSLDLEFLKGFDFLKMNEKEVFRFENEFLVNNVTGAASDIVRIPTIQYNGRLFWRGTWFEDAVPVEVGADLYFRSSNRANSYDPVTSQYYLQNDIKLKAYFTVDLFINMKIRNLLAFVKLVHINQEANNGYLTTPFYPGQQRIMDFGVRWLFFD